MPLQNRVTPFSEIVADPARGLFMGNRGILHDGDRTLGVARWRHRHWIICRTEFKQRHRHVMTPGKYTELFFLDEAVALAAGHRPCAECRRAEYTAFREAWMAAQGGLRPSADDMDRELHIQRVESRTRRQITFRAAISDLPDGTLICLDGEPDLPRLVIGGQLAGWTAAGYTRPVPRPGSGTGTVLTPRISVATLSAGFVPTLHKSAIQAPEGPAFKTKRGHSGTGKAN